MKGFSTLLGTTWCGNTEFKWGERTYIMGVLNLSPNSFSGDGLGGDVGAAVAEAELLAEEGADIIDIGGESTHPSASPLTAAEELRLVIPVIERLAGRLKVPLSIDTYKSEVARRAVAAGAAMINDVWGLKKDPTLAEVAAAEEVPLVLVQNQRDTPYGDFLSDLLADLRRSMTLALGIGVEWHNIICDPGVGFGKTVEQNLEVVRCLRELTVLGRPILLGTSRKFMVDLPPDQRVEATAATVALGIANGADMVRVHEVAQMARVARMSDAVVRPRQVRG